MIHCECSEHLIDQKNIHAIKAINTTKFLLSNNFSFVPSLPLAFAFESELKPHREGGGEEVDGDVEYG
jgi:hypothetical protein